MAKNYVSLASIVERVYRGTEYQNIPWQDVVEDIFDVIGLIGVPLGYFQKTTNGQGDNPIPIIINGFKGELPLDYAEGGSCRRIDLSNDGRIIGFVPMHEDLSLFYQTPVPPQRSTSNTGQMFASNVETASIEAKMQLVKEANEAGDVAEAERIMAEIVESLERTRDRSISSISAEASVPCKYKISNGIIHTNFHSGFVEMNYLAYPTDEQGMPMVPDNPRYIKAVEWYLIYRLDYKNWRYSRSREDERMMERSEQQYLFYAGAAHTQDKKASVDKMEAIKNMILRSIMKINEHRTGFMNSSRQESRKF